MKLIKRGLNFQVRSYDESTNTIEVVFSTGADVLRSSWFDDPVYERLVVTDEAIIGDRLKRGAPFLKNHSSYDVENDQLGTIQDYWVEDGKAIARIALLESSEKDSKRDLINNIKSGRIRNISVGYLIHDKGKTVGEKDGIEIREYSRWEPYEISIVAIPADPGCAVRGVEFEIDGEDGNEKPVDEVRLKTTEKQNSEEEAILKEQIRKQELDRIESIRKIAEDNTALNADFVSKAIQDGTTVEQATARALEATKEQLRKAENGEKLQRKFEDTNKNMVRKTSLTVGDEPIDYSKRGVVDAIRHRHNPEKNKQTDVGKEFRNLTLMDVAADCAGLDKRKYNKHEILKRAISSTDFPEILGELAENTSVESFKEKIDASFISEFTEDKSLPDFKEYRSAGFTTDPSLKQIEEGGEPEQYTLKTDKGEAWRLGRYAAAVKFTREAIINGQELDVMDHAVDIGHVSADLVVDLVMNVFNSNPAMTVDNKPIFHNDHRNLIKANLDILGMAKARQALRDQYRLNSKKKMNLQPSILLAGSNLETQALQFNASNLYPQEGNQFNPYAGLAKPIITGFLDDPDSWYLITGKGQGVKLIHIGYLDGQKNLQQTTETVLSNQSVITYSWLEVAVKCMDYRGFVKVVKG